jgi:hypothetical protein
MAKLHWSFGPATIPLHSNCDGGIVFCCVFKFKAFVARVFEVVFEGDEITGQLPLASGFEPFGHVVCVFDEDVDEEEAEEGEDGGQLPLASGFEPSGHGTGAVLLPPPVLPPPLLLLLPPPVLPPPLLLLLPPPVLPLLEE